MRICPKCSSIRVSPDFSVPGAISWGFMSSWKCERCGFVGNSLLFAEVPASNLPKPRSIKKYYPRLDSSFGRGLLGMMKVFGPVYTLSSISSYFIYPEHRFLSVFYGIIPGILITVYAYRRKYFEKNELMKLIALTIILYAAFSFFVL